MHARAKAWLHNFPENGLQRLSRDSDFPWAGKAEQAGFLFL